MEGLRAGTLRPLFGSHHAFLDRSTECRCNGTILALIAACRRAIDRSGVRPWNGCYTSLLDMVFVEGVLDDL